MHRLVKIAYLLGVVLMVGGLFLPWWRYAEFRYIPEISNDSVFLIVVLGVLILLQTFKPVYFLLKPTTWNILFAALLVFDALVVQGSLQKLYLAVFFQKLSIEIGLLITLCSSIFLLAIAVIHHRKIVVNADDRLIQILRQGSTAQAYKIFFALGLTLCVQGSISPMWLLPYQPDFHILPVNDMTVLSFWLELLIFARVIQSIHFLFKPAIWYALICTGLFLAGGYLFGKYLYLTMFTHEAITIQAGFIFFVVGSLIAFVTAIQYARNQSQDWLIFSKATSLIDVKIACVIGAILTIYYSFLPLWTHGDLVSTAYCAIQSVHCLTLLGSDAHYGGYAIILLSIAVLILVFQSKLAMWNVLMAFVLVLITGYYFNIFWGLNHWSFEPVSSAGPFLQRGFVLLILGASLLWVASVVHYNWPVNV